MINGVCVCVCVPVKGNNKADSREYQKKSDDEENEKVIFLFISAFLGHAYFC